MNQAEYFLANAVDGQLTDAQTMHMLALPEGEITTEQTAPEVKTSEPPAADVKASTDDGKAADPNPVLLAKDGVHTIPYDKLVEARNAEAHWKNVAAQAQAQLDAAIAAANEARKPGAPEVSAEAVTATVTADDADLFGDFSEESIRKGVATLVARQVAAIQEQMDAKLAKALEPIKRNEAEAAADEHFGAIEGKHPDVESVVQSEAMAKWIASKPSFLQPSIQAVIDGGTAQEVIELLDTFKAETGKTSTNAAAPNGVAAAAQAAVAKARTAMPTSLSEIPAGAAVHSNPAEQAAEMSDAALMNMFEGKTPEQINAMLTKMI